MNWHPYAKTKHCVHNEVESKNMSSLATIFFLPTVYQVIQYIYRLLPKWFKHLHFAFPCIRKITY